MAIACLVAILSPEDFSVARCGSCAVDIHTAEQTHPHLIWSCHVYVLCIWYFPTFQE